MKKEFTIVIIILLVVVAIGFFVLHDFNLNVNSTSNNVVKQSGSIDSSGVIHVGDISYTMPEGYKQGETNDLGHIAITNGSNKIFFAVYDDKSVDFLSEEYMNYTKAHNQTATVSKFTENGIDVTKNVNDQVGATHCWFNHNGKVYTIYTWAKTPNDDKIISNLINSIK